MDLEPEASTIGYLDRDPLGWSVRTLPHRCQGPKRWWNREHHEERQTACQHAELALKTLPVKKLSSVYIFTCVYMYARTNVYI